MTPIFSRIWFVKMQVVRAFEMSEVNLRNAALMSRACAPTVVSPISPSSSARVTSAATDSTTMTSSEFERINVSQMRSASSPELGCEDRKSTRLNSSHQIISYAVFCLKKKNYHNPHHNSDTHDRHHIP